ncbi:MAG: ABC transporter permease subunit [Cypionkella sp.]
MGRPGFAGLPTFAFSVLALGVISGTYQAEVYRGAYLAIDSRQTDAARALGLPRRVVLLHVIVPHLPRIDLPRIANVRQMFLKDSALILVIGMVELMRQAQIAAGSTREPFTFYIATAVLYLCIATETGALFGRAERRTGGWKGRA